MIVGFSSKNNSECVCALVRRVERYLITVCQRSCFLKVRSPVWSDRCLRAFIYSTRAALSTWTWRLDARLPLTSSLDTFCPDLPDALVQSDYVHFFLKALVVFIETVFSHSAPEYSLDQSEPNGGYKDSGFWVGPPVRLCWGAQRDSGNPGVRR